MVRKPELSYPLYFIKLHLYHKALILQLPTGTLQVQAFQTWSQKHLRWSDQGFNHRADLINSHQTRTVGATQNPLFMKDIMWSGVCSNKKNRCPTRKPLPVPDVSRIKLQIEKGSVDASKQLDSISPAGM